MQKFITYFLIIMLVLVGFISCENDDGFKNSQHQNEINLKTVRPTDAAKAFKEANSKKSGQSWITPYFQYNDSIGLNNSSAQITVTPVITSVTNAYSRLFSIEINGNLESVLYHMIPNDQSSPNSFWGKVVITDLSGDMLSAFDVEDNLYTGYYDIMNHPETINILEKANNKLNKNGDGGDAGNNDDNVDDPCDGCAWQDELGAVTVTAPGMTEDEVEIIIIFVPEITPDDGQGGVTPIPDYTPQSPSAPAGGTNESCPPGQIKDENGDCVDPPEEEEVECDEENGYYPDEDGNCVKDPCAEINNLIADSAYKAKLAELNTPGNTNNSDEQGYGQTISNGPIQLSTSNNGHSVSYAGLDLNNMLGFVHTHPCGQEDTGTGSSTTLVGSIPMPSPTDIWTFRRLLSRALENGRNLQDIYMTVINCNGIFDLKYTGDGNNLANFNMDEDNYRSYFDKNDNPVVAFEKYLDEVVNMNGKNGFELYEYVEDEATNEYEAIRKELNSDGDDIVSINNCN